ncbi:MAG TPA: 30S ribosomal protein S20 [Candidatus Limnocylindria bacterium]|nr:30S ribosomal protein S20 [Candidatus Limnocylindria bacterium]
MPNIRSSIKRVKVNAKKNLRNRMVKSQVKTAVRKYTLALANDAGQAMTQLSAASSALDRAVSKGIIHRNTANRKKARLAKALNKAQA